MDFSFGFDSIPQDIVKLTRPRNRIKAKRKRRKKQLIKIVDRLLHLFKIAQQPSAGDKRANGIRVIKEIPNDKIMNSRDHPFFNG